MITFFASARENGKFTNQCLLFEYTSWKLVLQSIRVLPWLIKNPGIGVKTGTLPSFSKCNNMSQTCCINLNFRLIFVSIPPRFNSFATRTAFESAVTEELIADSTAAFLMGADQVRSVPDAAARIES